MKRLILAALLISVTVTQAHADVFLSRIARIGTVRAVKTMNPSFKIRDFYTHLAETKSLANRQLRDHRTPWNNGFVQADKTFLRTKLSDDSILDISVLTEIKKSPSNQKINQTSGISILTNTKDEALFNDIIETLGAQNRRVTNGEGQSEGFRIINIPFEVEGRDSSINTINRVALTDKIETLIRKLNAKTLGSNAEPEKLIRSRVYLRSSSR